MRHALPLLSVLLASIFSPSAVLAGDKMCPVVHGGTTMMMPCADDLSASEAPRQLSVTLPPATGNTLPVTEPDKMLLPAPEAESGKPAPDTKPFLHQLDIIRGSIISQPWGGKQGPIVDTYFDPLKKIVQEQPALIANVNAAWYESLGDAMKQRLFINYFEKKVETGWQPDPPAIEKYKAARDGYYSEKGSMARLHSVDALGMAFMDKDRELGYYDKAPPELRRRHDSGLLDSPRGNVFKGGTLLQMGDAQGALQAYNKALAAAPNSVGALSGRAAANYELGNYADANRDAHRALELDPANKSAYGTAKLTDGRVGGGEAGAQPGSAAYGRGFMGGGASGGAFSFGGATRSPGAAAAARFNDQAKSALTMNDNRAALDYASRAIGADAQNALAYYLKAMAYKRMGDWKAAAEAAAKGLELSPKNSALLAVYGQSLNRTKDHKAALAAANLALEVNPRDPWAFSSRAYALGALGDREGMLENLRRAAELDPAFQQSLDQALQAPTDADLLFLFPGETATDKKGAMGGAGRKKSFGVLAVAASVGGLLLALGLLSPLMGPVKEKVTSVFTRITRRSPAVTAVASVDETPRAAGLLRGQYELGKQIGAGGMGLVFEGTDRSLNRRVAVKRMRDEIRLDPRERARFVAEAKTVAALHHPGIVDIYAIVEDADDLHLVFEYVEGRTVHELIAQKGRFAPAEAARVVRGAAEALDFAHGRGVIHRDMKPSNLMVDGAGRLKVMDFGIARAAKDAMTRYSMTNTIVGTPPYMAPEQEQGQVRKESDVYALAICAYELLCGRLPFPGVGAGMLMNKINLSYVPPSKMTEGLPPALDDVFAKAFQPDPEKRFRTSGEFASALEAALAASVRA